MSDVHRHYPELDPDIVQAAQLLGIGPHAGEAEAPAEEAPAGGTVLKPCRDCGTEFAADPAKYGKSKWYTLCAYCLADHI